MSERVKDQATARVGKAESEPLVPVWGLAIAGVVIVVLIVTIARNWLWGIDFFHVVGGALWFSIDLFMGFVIGPLLARLDVPARMAVTRRLMPKMLIIMPVVVISTLTAAWQLAQLGGWFNVPYPQHWWLVAAFIVVGLMAIIAYGVLEPANILVLLELRKPEPNGIIIGRTMRRFIYGAAVIGVLQVAVIIIMTRMATW
jgi:hypothetical protein